MRGRRVLAASAAAVCLGLLTAAPAPAAGRTVEAGAVQSSSGIVSLVATVSPMPTPPLTASAFSATSDGQKLTVQANRLLPDHAAAAFVVDASADGAEALSGDGRSGAAGFLLQLPPATTTVVVADRKPAAVIAGPTTTVTAGLTAVAGLNNTGVRDTAAAIDLALKRLPAYPTATPVVVLQTSAADAGGEAAEALAARLKAVHAVLAVVTTAPSADYWSRAAEATGGLAVQTTPARAIPALDRIADGLRSRYVVGVARPPAGGAIELKVGSATTTVDTPAESAPPTPATTPSPTDDGRGATRFVAPVLITLLVLGALAFVVALVVTRRLAREKTPEPRPDMPYAVEVAPGVHMYEGADLFEPRASRDAREASRPAPKLPSQASAPPSSAAQPPAAQPSASQPTNGAAAPARSAAAPDRPDSAAGQPPTAREVAEHGATLFQPRTAPDARPPANGKATNGQATNGNSPGAKSSSAKSSSATSSSATSSDASSSDSEDTNAEDDDPDATQQRYFDIPRGPRNHPEP